MNEQVSIGVIGGSGLRSLDAKHVRTEKISTPYGDPSDSIDIMQIGNTQFAFLPRHGRNHNLLPHEVPNRANLYALRKLGVQYLLNFTAVGSLTGFIKPGDFVIYDSVIDMTNSRPQTFFGNGLVGHASTADAFCPTLKDIAAESMRELGIKHQTRGTCVTIQGPCFGDKATSLFYQKQGFGIVGMTQEPLRKLCCEASMCCVSIAMVTDNDCWSDDHVTAALVEKMMKSNKDKATALIRRMVPKIPPACKCGHCYKGSKIIITPKSVWTKEHRELMKVLYPYDNLD